MAKATPKKGPGKGKKAVEVRRSADPVRAGCSCCPDCTGKPSGTMGGCEDGVCRDVPPPQGAGPWVLYWATNINGNFPYWESVANVIAAWAAGVGIVPPPAPAARK